MVINNKLLKILFFCFFFLGDVWETFVGDIRETKFFICFLVIMMNY